MPNQETSPDVATTLFVDLLKPVIQQAVADAIAELTENVQPRPPRPLTVKETAEYLSIPLSSIYQLTSKRTIPFFKRGKHLFFYQDQLDGWVKGEEVSHA